MSPLADPVSSAIFSSVEVAGLAAESLISAILNDCGDELKGKITSITPQRVHISLGDRGCRVDMEMPTDAGEDYIVELQINPDAHIVTRNIFAAAHKFVSSSKSGDSSSQMAKRLPKLIYINVFAYNCRSDNDDVVQPFGIMYKKGPFTVVVPNFSGYNIQLPKVVGMKQDFDSPLYCWCYALYMAHVNEKSMKEVVDMTTELQAFANRDAGFQQFCDRYKLVASDPKTRDEYVRWAANQMREEGVRDAALEEGRENAMLEVAIKKLRKGQSFDFVVDDLELTTDLANIVRKIAENEGLSIA
jgi:predicted transposase/invertase (TIGR01784 family)